jgi:NAD(P)-dependent dehydrogenase (short-subunit alcohol dehydrogenase family)
VNAVSPGLVDTEQNRTEMGDQTRAMVTREQLAEVVLFLASDGASGVNGEVVSVLGGRLS